MTHKYRFVPVLAILALSILIAACSGQSAAPATATLTTVPAPTHPPQPTPSPTATQAPTVVPLIQESPLQPQTGVSPLQPPSPQTYVPAPDAECQALSKAVSGTLNAEATTETAGFRDYVADINGQGCLITVRGTGSQFPGFVQVAQQLQALLEGQGWTVDPAYFADSPTGTLFALRKGSELALVDVGWLASAGVNCPPDQPISACDIKPEQQNYTITVNVAQAQ